MAFVAARAMSIAGAGNPNRHRCARWCRRLAVLVLCASASIAPADDGPVVLGRREKTDFVHIDPAAYRLDLIGNYQHDSIDQGASHSSSSNTSFEETLSAETTGYIVHPNLIDLNLSGTAGLAQRFFDTSDQSNQENGTIYAWNVRATGTRNQTWVPTLYSSRTQTDVNRDFGPTDKNTSMIYGLSLDRKSATAPLRINLYHRDENLDSTTSGTGLFTPSQYALAQDTAEIGGSFAIGDRQSLGYSASYSDVDQTSQTGTDDQFQSTNAMLTYSNAFGGKRQNTLWSTLEYQDQNGDFAQRRLRFDNQLRLQHTDRFETNYNYNFSDETLLGQEQTIHRGSVQARHRLFESLITTAEAGGQVQDIGGSKGDEEFATLGLDYRKKLRLGSLYLDTSGGVDRFHSDAITQSLFVIDESRTFSDPFGVNLNHRNIELTSIRITDSANLVTYQEGIDYTLRKFGNRVQIQRVPTGSIPFGSSVLVDYRILPEPSNTTHTLSWGMGGRYELETGPMKGLGFYARYRMQHQQIDAENPDFFIPNDLRDYLVGMDYRLQGFEFSTEHEWHHSLLDPYEVTRFSARWSHRLDYDTSFSITGTYSIMDHQDDSTETTKLFTVNSEISRQISRRLSARATVLFRDENDSLIGSTTGLEEFIELRWMHRQTEVYMQLRNADFDSGNLTSSFQYIQLGFRRYF